MFLPFKKRIHRQIGELSIVVVLIWSFIITSFVPQIVDAKTFEFVNLTKFFTVHNVANAEILPSFPEIGDVEPRNVLWTVMTAYSSEAAQTDSTPCIPADWTYNLCEHYEDEGAQDTIAANFLPLGTKVRFPDLYGDKIFTVRDRMNARYGNARGDFWMPERQLAVDFGVQRVKMEVYYK
ncbi:3D domain-containing protein [Candidatus Parcubacteria bacterium]|jgi:3D (Asp-Asp-Asp) domain-containing protein|nr:3D domain-containing protein [Candidatus Parcubacteria bacterium]